VTGPPLARILIVDDEPHIRRLLRTALDRAGYAVDEAASGQEALSQLSAHQPDLVLLDLGLPDRDGIELVSVIRSRSTARVVVISAREMTEDKVAALDLGADDFVTKPFDTAELLARVRVVLRQRQANQSGTPLRIGAIEIDLDQRRVTRSAVLVHLTPKEFALLAELARHHGRIITHAQLLRSVWGRAHEQDVEYLRVTVRSLRAKLEETPTRPVLILNEPGIGYRLAAEDRGSPPETDRAEATKAGRSD